jgi:hypothetical protein
MVEEPYLESGMFYALTDLLHAMRDSENRQTILEDFKNDPVKQANMIALLQDLIAILLSFIATTFLMSDDMRKDERFKYDMMYAMLVNPANDNNPVKVASGILDVFNTTTGNFNKQLVSDVFGCFTNNDNGVKNFTSNFAMIDQPRRWLE